LNASKHSRGSTGSSPMLEDFRNSKNRSWTVEEIRGHVVEFCQDRNGSRFIQQRLKVADASEKQLIMTEVLPFVRVLRNDVFGNYVVQKLLEHGTIDMKSKLRETLIGEMLSLSLQMYGCRVIKKSLEVLPDEDIFPLLAEFHGNVITCIHVKNGNHVMQKSVEVLSNKAKNAGSQGPIYSDQIEFIIDDVLKNVETLSLLDDQYGNYVIQHVLQFGRNSDRDSVLEIVVDNGLLAMS